MTEDIPEINLIDLKKYTWDPDSEELEYYVVNQSNLDFNISINGSLISVFPPLNWFGTLIVDIGVNDGTSLAIDSLILFIQPVNDQPIINSTESWIVGDIENVRYLSLSFSNVSCVVLLSIVVW